ncbi:MAG: hypothetical protein A2406_01370 [Candidatus Komeilibacteria bacterium RIFOXYC1_FULL_37_11]|uniref:Uncharacterized protein n=1 Tax=Candidatus Komeilibacteria bacterium RIFOXYC1_FULL_37_11 TaxID=1798555 RepID=A0A1G2BY43_9BACT|nr:MAG: hypothetical protein A2406_01370 [Candidatus Komeilibacteria bacterium RIFOXYC1_FULL_37_11]OGY96019.1 MAG: hypothetical protein A2611_04400 [Candidatus Komeilibacteria bacterium RIFOXYD1_FULL_37_29]
MDFDLPAMNGVNSTAKSVIILGPVISLYFLVKTMSSACISPLMIGDGITVWIFLSATSNLSQ